MSTVSATITPLRLAAVGTVLGALVACQGSGGSSGPSDTPLAAVSPHATAEATPTPTPRAPITVERTVDGVDGLASDGQTLVWGSGPGTELWTSRLDGSGQRRVWSAPHRQGFLSGFGLSGSWVVMTETLPPSSPNGQFPAAWYVWAVNLGDGTAVMLDQAESQPAIEEPPVPSIEATLVVWDTPRTSGGGETLRTYDLATKQGTTLPLPPTVYPVHPQVRGGVIYFMDNATDPHRNNETVISRGGQVVGWHLGSGVLSRLPTALDAFNAEVGPEDVVWLDRNVQQLYVTPLTGGGPSRSLGSCVTPLIRGDTTALCLPPSQRQMTEYVLAIGRALPLPPTVDFGAPGVVVGGVLYAGGPHLTITAFHLPT